MTAELEQATAAARLEVVRRLTLTPKKEVFVFIHGVANLDIIVYEGGGGGLFRHGYYTDPVASSDMLMLLRYGWAPGQGQRDGLEPIRPNIWRIAETSSGN